MKRLINNGSISVIGFLCAFIRIFNIAQIYLADRNYAKPNTIYVRYRKK